MRHAYMILALLGLAAADGNVRVRDDKEYFPYKAGAKWTYEVETPTDKEEQICTLTGTEKVGETECWVVEVKNSKSWKEYFALNEKGLFLYKGQGGNDFSDNPIPRVKFPLKKGDTWEWKGKQGGSDMQATYTNEGEEEIEVAGQKVACWKVNVKTSAGTADYKVTRWYGKGMGLVKQVYTQGDDEEKTLTTKLKKFEAGEEKK